MEKENKKKGYWVSLFLFVFGLGLLAEAFVQNEIVSLASAVIFGGLLTFIGAKGLWSRT